MHMRWNDSLERHFGIICAFLVSSVNSFFHSFCNLLINKGFKRSRFARYDSMQHHVYASHMYTYIRYRYRFFLWTLSFLKIWIHFLIPDVDLCNTSYYVGFESCSCEVGNEVAILCPNLKQRLSFYCPRSGWGISQCTMYTTSVQEQVCHSSIELVTS